MMCGLAPILSCYHASLPYFDCGGKGLDFSGLCVKIFHRALVDGTASMGKTFSFIVLPFLSVLMLTFWAETALANRRVALVIGNSQYTRITPKLPNPVNDSHDIAQALESIGFEVILKTDISKGEFDHSLADFARKAAGADTALFYYAGHGLQYQRRNFFLPVDIDVQDSVDVEFQAVGMDRILEAVNHAVGVKIVILDACRNNPLANQLAHRSLGGGITRGLARIDRTEGLIVAYATAPDQVAQDGTGRNSPFTESLIRRIKEPGLEIGTMFRRVANDVFERTNGRQRPEYSVSLLSDYFLNPTESDSVAWSRTRDSNEKADFQNFIRKFPDSPFARDAQMRIDLFERIRRENEEAETAARKRIAQEAEKKRQEEAAKKEADHIATERREAHRTAEQREADRWEVERIAERNRRVRESPRAEQQIVDKEETANLEFQRREADRQEVERLAAARRAQLRADREEVERLAAAKRAQRLEVVRPEAARRDAAVR